MDICPTCTTSRPHSEKFDRIYGAIFTELNKGEMPCVEDVGELAMALSVLVADALDIDIYV